MLNGFGEINAGGNQGNGLAFHPLRSRKSLYATGTGNKHCPNEPLDSYAVFTLNLTLLLA